MLPISTRLSVLLLVGSLVFLPACRKKSSSKNAAHTHAHGGTHESSTPLGVYDEDIEAFVLEESIDPLDGSAHHAAGVTFVVDAEDGEPNNAALYGLKTVYFDFDRYAVRKDQRTTLDHDVKKIKELINQGHRIVIEGHACNSAGSAQYNLQLSAKRARVVYDHLVKAGIPKNKLNFVGRGCEMPIVPHGNRQQQASNRRVEFFVQSSEE